MNKTYIPALIFITLLSVLHFIASELHFYTTVMWFDEMMHILGGMGLAFFLYWLNVTFIKSQKISFSVIIFFTFLLGLSWEVWETYYDIAGAPVGTNAYYIDTIKDLFNDIIGAIIAC